MQGRGRPIGWAAHLLAALALAAAGMLVGFILAGGEPFGKVIGGTPEVTAPTNAPTERNDATAARIAAPAAARLVAKPRVFRAAIRARAAAEAARRARARRVAARERRRRARVTRARAAAAPARPAPVATAPTPAPAPPAATLPVAAPPPPAPQPAGGGRAERDDADREFVAGGAGEG